ncbi:Protein unc-93 homolog A (Unc-93A) [Durusdinium trenchii]|uniref:Protein unc-93 homolog A (Unc-93A) n=1 Tax=Durusdinium trenchii TaxID=1381693 RepID=A0ABP0QWM8_9DINO
MKTMNPCVRPLARFLGTLLLEKHQKHAAKGLQHPHAALSSTGRTLAACGAAFGVRKWSRAYVLRGQRARAESGEAAGFTGYSEDKLRQNFNFMAVLFAVNHGVVTTPLAVSTSLLNLDTATFGNGLLYAVTLFSSLLLGAPIVGQLGPKGGLTFGMLFYCLYIACFAASLSSLFDAQWLFTVGSACGGLAAGVLWTAQGTYFASSAAEIANVSNDRFSRDEVTADLSGQFAFSYLLLEVVSKLFFSLLQALGMEVSYIAAIYFLIGAGSLAFMFQVYDLPGPSDRAKPLDKLLACVSLWSDPAIWLLAPTNLSFGFCAAYMNGFVNANFAAQELGQQSVAFLGAVTALTAAFLAKAYGPLSKSGKGFVITLGAASAAAIPLLTFNGCLGWGWWLLSLYFLQGSVRAVYESTNRAMFSDFFPGQSEGAFANCMLQSSLGFATCFFLQSSLRADQLSTIIIGLAVSTCLGYYFASGLRQAERDSA